MSKPFIPFGFMPGHWGLKGKTREVAQAEYELEADSIDLAYRLAEIHATDADDLAQQNLVIDFKFDKLTLNQYDRLYATNHMENGSAKQKLALLRLDRKEDIITELAYKIGVANVTYEAGSKELALALNHAKHEENDITDLEYEKELATLNEVGWVHIVNIEIAKERPDHGELNLDWNDFFVAELREGGYDAALDDQVVDMWLADLCRNIAMEQFTGIGDFDERVNDQFIQKSNTTDDGTWEAK